MKTVDESKEIVGAAVAMIPSGCSILTVTHKHRSTGMLVSWVQQVSFEPLLLCVCVKRGRPAQELIDAAGRFVLNVVGDDPSAMFKHFGKGFSLDEEAFDGVATQHSEYGPVLTDCVAHLGCAVTQKVAAGDHDLYIVTVEAGRATEGAKPYVHLRKSGLSY